MNLGDINTFSGSLIKLSYKHVQIMGHVTLEITYREEANVKVIDVSYFIVDTLSPYNIIMGILSINNLGAVVSTWYLTMKYMLLDERVGTIGGD